MVRCRVRTLVVALAAWAGAWATPPPARADFQLLLIEDGNLATLQKGTVLGSDPNKLVFSGSVGAIAIDMTVAKTNSPGGNSGVVQIMNTDIINQGTTSHQLTVIVSSQGFTSPMGSSLSLLATVSGSVVSGQVSGNFTGFGDPGNNLMPASAASNPSTIPGTAIATPTISFSGSGPSQSFSGNSSTVFSNPNETAYSLSIISNYYLSSGAEVTLTGGNTQTVTPVPAGMVLALSGIPVLGLGCWFRRRRPQGLKALGDLAVA